MSQVTGTKRRAIGARFVRSAFSRSQRIAAMLALFSMLWYSVVPAGAGTNFWQQSAAGTPDSVWDNLNNWSLGTIAGASDDVIFPSVIPATGGAITLASGDVANSLTFRNSYTLNTGDLSLSSGNVTVATGSTATINSQILGGAPLTLAADNGLPLTDNQLGGGTLVLGGANLYFGGTNVNAGTLRFTTLGSLGTGDATVNAGGTLEAATVAGALNNNIILNGGTFKNTPAVQLTLAAGRTLSVNADSTINVVATGPGGKLLLAGGQLNSNLGTTLTKTGAGDLQLSGANSGFQGNLNVNGGFLEMQHVDALGTGTVNVTVNNGGEFLSSGVAVRHNFTLNTGSTLSANGNGGAAYTGTINVAGNSTIALRQFQGVNTPNSLSINGVISGPGNLTVNAPAATSTALGSLLLTGNNSTYASTITVNNNAQLRAIQGATTDALGSASIVLGGGTLGISPEITAQGANAGFRGHYYLAASTGVSTAISDGVIGGYDFGVTQNATLRVPDAVRTDSIISFSDFTQAAQRPTGFNPATNSNFGVQWTGILNVAAGGTYSFSTSTDDGSLIYIDGQPTTLNDFSQGVTTRTGSINLAAGNHSIVVKYGQGGGGTGIVANYSGPDTGGSSVNIGSLGNVTNTGSILLTAAPTTIDNNISLTAATGSAIDMSATSVISTGTLTFGNNSRLSVTGLTGNEMLTQQGNVSLNGINTVIVGIPQNTAGNRPNASSGADLTVSGAIGESAPGAALYKYGPRNVTLLNTNTYTGGTFYTGGTQLTLNAPGGNAIPGDLTLTANAITGVVLTAKELASNQISDTGIVTLAGFSGIAGSNLDLNNFNDTIGGVVFVNNQGSGVETVSTGTGTLTLNGNVVMMGTSTGNTQFTGNLNLGGATRTFTTSGLGTPTIAALVTNGSITKAGLGSLLINQANAGYTGVTTINQGKLSVNNATALGTTGATENTVVNAGGFLDVVNVAISEPLTLNGRGQPVPATTGIGGAMYSGALQGSGGTAGAVNAPITLGSNTSIGVGTGNALTISGVISDGGSGFSLTKTQGNGNTGATPATLGAGGTLVLTGVNTYTGPTTIEAGELRLASAGQAIASTVVNIGDTSNNGATLTLGGNNQMPSNVVLNFNNSNQNAKFQLNGFNQTVAGFNTSGTLPIIQNFETAGAGTSTLTVDAPVDTRFAGLIRNQSGTLALTKQGVGTLTISGNGALGQGNVAYTGLTSVLAGKLVFEDSTSTIATPITVSGTGALEFKESYGRTTIYNAALTDNGLGFTKSGLGNLTVQALGNVTGTVNVNAGTLDLTDAAGNVNPLPGASFNVAAGAQLQFFGVSGVNTTFNNNITLNGMTLGGAFSGTVVGGTPTDTLTGTLTLNATSNISTGWSDKVLNLNGQITGAAGAGLVIDKLLYTQNPPIININNLTNNYTGDTVINSGTVTFANGALPSTGNLKFGGTFGNGGNFGTGQLVLSTVAGTTFTRTVGTGPGQVQFTGDGGGFSAIGALGTVTFGNAGPIDWSGTGTTGLDANSSLVLNSGTGANNEVNITNDINLNGGMRRVSVNANVGRLSGSLSGTGGLIVDGGATLNLTGANANSYTGRTDFLNATINLNKTGGVAVPGDVHVGQLAGNAIMILGANEQIADTAVITFAGMNGANGWLRTGGFTETVAGIQDRSGGGVIENSAGGTGNGLVIINGANDSFFNGFFRNTSGTIGLTKNGAGTLTISAGQQSGTGSQNYSGATNINGGTLVLRNISSYGSAVTIGAAGTLGFDVNINQSFTENQVLSGAGNLFKNGLGTEALSGTNNYSGTTTVNAGTLQISGSQGAAHLGVYTVNSGGTLLIGNGSTAGVLTNNNAITVNAGGTVAFSRNNTAPAYTGVISGAGNVETRTGGGVITLSGANTYTGTTTATGGNIIVAGSGISGGGIIARTGGAVTLDFNQLNSSAADIVLATAPVTLGTDVVTNAATGGTLNILGNATGTNSQTLGNVTLNRGLNTISLTAGATGTLAANFGNITATPGALLNITLPAGVTATTTTPGVGGILGGFATTNNGGNFVAIDGLGGLSTLASGAADSYGPGINTDVITGGAGASTNSLRFNAAGNAVVTFTGSNVIASGGILQTAAVGASNNSITGGSISGGVGTGLTILQAGGGLNISSSIVDNGGASALAKAGAGTLVLTGANTYSGPTIVTQGTLVTLGTTGSGLTTVAPGATLQIGDGISNGIAPAVNNFGTLVLNSSANQTISTPLNAGGNFNFTANALNNPTSFQTGVITKTGAGTLTLTNAVVTNQFHPRTGLTVIDTGGNVQVSNFASIGLLNGDNAAVTVKGIGRYTVNGDTNISDQSSSRGTLNIQDQGIVTAGTLYVGKTGTSVGVVNQTFGTMQNNGGGDWRIGGNGTAGADTGAYGIYNLSAGNFSTSKNFQIGASGVGVFNQTGGTVSITGGTPSIGRFAGGFGLLNITNGTFTNSTTTNVVSGENGTGIINVGGAGQLLVNVTTANVGLALGGATADGTVNLLTGGLIQAGQVRDFDGNTATASKFNFNGGTLRVTPATVNGATYMTGLTAATIYSGGANIDTNGVATTIGQSFVGPAGNGLTDIAFGTGGSGYVGEPVVSITGGGGTGATARAVVSGGVVTGFVITSPGTNYTSAPTVTLLGGGSTSPATAGIVTTAANVTTGGLTKLNTGVLTLTGTNGVTLGTSIGSPHTYLGATSVNGGTLSLDYTTWTNAPTDMINNASVLQLGGGNLTILGHANGTAATPTGTYATNSNAITVSANTGLVVGQSISGAGIPAGAVITSINGTAVTISAVTTAAGAAGTPLAATAYFSPGTSQTFAATKINAGGSVINTLTSGSGLTLNLGLITRSNGGTVDFVVPSTSSITTTTANGTGIIGGWATAGTAASGGQGWAFSTADGGDPGNIVMLPAGGIATNTWAATNNTDMTIANTLTNATTNSVRFNTGTPVTVTVSGTDVINSGGILVTPTATVAATIFTGGILNSANASSDLIVNQFSGAAQTIVSAIGAGTGGLVKAGPGILILSSPTTTNLYTGPTTIGGGTLRIGVTEQIPNASTVTISAGASLDLNNLAETINGLSGYGNVVNSVAGTPTLTVGAGGANSTFSGLLVNGTGNLALTKTGGGTLTLNNIVAGSFTGGTTISQGAIDIATPQALANNTTITVNAANGLLFDTTVPVISALAGSQPFALQTQGTSPLPNAPVQLTIGNNNAGATYSGALTGSGTLIKIGSGLETLSGNNTNTGGLVVNGGTLVLQGNNTGAGGSIFVNNGGSVQINTTNSFYGASGRTLVIGSGGVVTTQANTANSTSNSFGAVSQVFSRIDLGSTGVLGLQVDGSLQLPVTENLDFAANNSNLSLGSVLTANSGAGNAPVQYTGVITPNANTFRIGGGSGRLILPNGGTLTGANNLNLYGGGSGGLVYLTGNYDYSGTTTVNGGTTYLTNLVDGGIASNLGASSAAASNLVLNGGTLSYVGSGSSTNRLFTLTTSPTAIDSSGTGPLNFTATGPVAFLNSGNRTLTLQGQNTGTNTIAASIGDSIAVTGSSAVVANGLTGVTKNGNGTWVLSGNNTFTGGVIVNNGVLEFTSPAAMGGLSVAGPANIFVNGGGAVAFGPAFGSVQAGLMRVSPTRADGQALQNGSVALTADSNESLNFDGGSGGAALPQITLGAYGNVTYTGNLTPFGGTYRLGGGGGVLSLPNGGLTGPRVMVIGGGGPGASLVNNPNLNGAVVLGGTSDYSGGTIITTGSVLSATNVAAVGTGPLKFQGGFYRAVDGTDITLASDGVTPREIRIGTDASSIAQTANVDVVNGVSVTFSKTFGILPTLGSNYGQENFTKFGGGTLILANGINLGLTNGSNNVATNAGTLIIERGTLGIAANPTNFVGNIRIGNDSGGVATLKLAADNVFANTVAQFGSASIIDGYSGSKLDLNGHSDTIRLLRGMASIVNTGASTANLTVGTNSEQEINGGNLIGNFTLTVTGNVKNTPGGSGNLPGLELWNNNNSQFTGKLVANANAIRIRADGTLGSPTEPFMADKITLNNNAGLTSGTAVFVPVVIGANHGITLGATGGTLSAPANFPFVVNSPITGSGMLTIGDETGTVMLGSDNNTYTGGTTVTSVSNRGYFSIGAGGATGSLPAGDVIFNTAATATANTGGRLFFFKSTDMTIPNNFIGAGSLIQYGAGTTTLTGNNNTNQPTQVAGGRLKADFTGGNSPISNGTALIVSGGAFEYAGAAGNNTLRLGAFTAGFAPSIASATYNNGNVGDSVVQSTYGGSGVQTLSLLSNARTNTSGTMNFITSGGENGVTNKIVFDSGPADNNVINGGYYFNGSDFAALDALQFVRAPIYGNDNNTAPLNTIQGSRYVKLTSSPASQAAALSLNGLVLSGNNVNFNMSAAVALTMVGNPGTILKSGGGSSLVNGIAGATLNNNGQDLILRTDTAADNLQVDLPIAGGGSLLKSGLGNLTLTGANTYTGSTFIMSGTTLVTGSAALGTTTNGTSIRIADSAGSVATLTMDSAGATIRAGGSNQGDALRVGESGNGTFNMSAGLVNAGQFVTIGDNMGATGVVNMSGGIMNVKNNDAATPALVVGRAGTGTLNISGNAVINVKNGAQVLLGNGAPNSSTAQTFQTLVANTAISTGVGIINQTGGTLNVDTKNGGYQSNVIGGVILGVDGAGTYNLNGGTLSTSILARGNGTANFNLGGGTIKAPSPVPTLPISIFNLDLPINVTGTGAGKGIIDTNGNDATATSTITGVGGLAKAGAGTLTVIGNGSNYAGGTDITNGSVVSSGTSLGTGAVNVAAGSNLIIQGVQKGLLARFYAISHTDVTTGVTAGNVAMSTEFASLENFNAYVNGKALVAAESTAARGKVSLNYLEDGGGNQNTAVPPALRQLQNGSLPYIAHIAGKFNAATAGDYTFQARSDDGTVVWIDGVAVLDNNKSQGQTTRTGTINMTAGFHDIVVGYYEGGGGSGFTVGVTLPGQGQSFVIGSELNMSNDLLSYGSNNLTVGSLAGAGNTQLGAGTLVTGGDGTDTTYSGAFTGTGGNVVKQGAGTMTITGTSHTYTGSTTVNGGTLAVTGSIASSSGVTVNNTGTFEAGSSQVVKALSVNTGGLARIATGPLKILTVGNNTSATPLAIAGTGKVDLNSNVLIVDYSAGNEAAALTSVRDQIVKGYNASAPGAGDGNWQGNGITSTDAVLAPSKRAVGYAQASELLTISGTDTADYLGQTVDATSIIVRATLNGDADLDGAVGFSDLVAVAQHYGLNNGSNNWIQGDFNYDGIVDFADLVAVAQNYNSTLPSAPVGAPAIFANDMAAAFAFSSSVPEPGSLSVVALAGLALLRRRRR